MGVTIYSFMRLSCGGFIFREKNPPRSWEFHEHGGFYYAIISNI